MAVFISQNMALIEIALVALGTIADNAGQGIFKNIHNSAIRNTAAKLGSQASQELITRGAKELEKKLSKK